MFDRALAMKIRHPELAYYNRAMAHEAAGNIEAAYSDYSAARRIAPKWDQPKEELSRFRVGR
jgi:tetratricopeptide (TPR) repeat protein